MGGRSRGDIQDRIIGGFHHGGALALSPNFEFLRRRKAIFVSDHYVTRQGTYKVVTWVCRVVFPEFGWVVP